MLSWFCWEKWVERIIIRTSLEVILGFPGGSVVKNLPANARDLGSIPGSGRSYGEGHGNLLQNSYLKNPSDQGRPWRATVHRVTKSQTWLKDEQATTEGQAMLFSPSVVLELFQDFFFLRIGVVFRDIPMLTVGWSSLIIVSVVFLVHLPPPTSSCPLSSSTHLTNAHPHICIFEQPQAPGFAMLMQIKEGGRKHVETSKAAMFKVERQKTTAQRQRIDKEERIEYSRIE